MVEQLLQEVHTPQTASTAANGLAQESFCLLTAAPCVAARCLLAILCTHSCAATVLGQVAPPGPALCLNMGYLVCLHGQLTPPPQVSLQAVHTCQEPQVAGMAGTRALKSILTKFEIDNKILRQL